MMRAARNVGRVTTNRLNVTKVMSRGRMATWTFSALPAARMAALSEPPTRDAIFDRVADEMKVLCCHPAPCDNGPQFSRVVFCIQVATPTFDLFFNSEAGYRGAYYLSPYDGLAANRAFIKRISPRLIAWSSLQCPDIGATESLASPSAKAWLAEIGSGICKHCAGEWSAKSDGPEIRNGRWEHEDSKGGWGRKAPYLSKLKIFGAFLDERQNVLIPHDKRHRAIDIYKFGWS